MVEGAGFEPAKAEPSDLQSDPFGHSGTPPRGTWFVSKATRHALEKRMRIITEFLCL